MIGRSLRRWTAPSGRAGHAAELEPVTDCAALAVALCRFAPSLDGASFLIVRTERFDAKAFNKAVHRFQSAGGRARVCLAGDRATLASADAAGVDHDSVGLMLDAVDAHTPPFDLIWDRIEAVRFSDDFVSGAGGSLRLRLALELMLGLAKDLGLCTLGSADAAGSARVAERPYFDYENAEEPSTPRPWLPEARAAGDREKKRSAAVSR